MDDSTLEVRRQQDLDIALQEADNIIMKKYMSGICRQEIKAVDSETAGTDLNSVFRLNKIEKLVYDSEENSLEKLMNVYNAVGLCGGSIINIIISDGKKVDYYIGTRSSNVNGAATCQDTLISSFLGNFQGSKISPLKKGDMNICLEKVFENDNKPVTVVCGIPGYRNEENKDNRKYVQGMERVIDSMAGKSFSMVTISTPVNPSQKEQIKDGYEQLYTQISPFAETQLSYNESDSNAVAETITDGVTRTIGESLTTTISSSQSRTEGTTTSKSYNGSLIFVGMSTTDGSNLSNTNQKGKSNADSHNESESDSHSKGKTDTYTNTNGRSLQINIENKAVKNLLNKIDAMIKRIEDSADIGLWNTATYCMADNSQTSQVLASAVEALCRGKKTSVESFAVATWTGENNNIRIKEYLKKMVHPIVIIKGNNENFEVNPSSLISGKELVIEAGLPQKSVPGLPVSEMATFSRNVINEISDECRCIKLGNVYHMGCVEDGPVNLDIESLSAHTLITGSTGSGKSNAVYHIISELRKEGIKFLIVEPAKGEYKNIFGNDSDVKVLGTNEKYAEILKINPFRFPNSVHVLEHVDRLVEIFNVCWPMYAAMPAVLKDAVLGAYENCGWNLEDSVNEYGNDVFPTFKDLQRELLSVIGRSAYSDEVKGNYIGSLATRVKSLTNGINGKIFTDSDLRYKDIFDHNTIIDLSRVGSSETKSLIMGLVVMALNEYRMDQSVNSMNQELKHITVLEEAHNLLRSTASSGGLEEGHDLAGKSIEMLANSIAEMRTYGEGFIIVDQSPGAIDISAIRNTNTKIIMRLPEENDRKQAGKSAALNDKQIDELTKLNRGVAVVYQNNWLDPVLCAIEKANVKEKPYNYSHVNNNERKIEREEVLKFLMKNRVDEKIDFDLDVIEHSIDRLNLSTKTKLVLQELVEQIKEGQEPQVLQEEGFKSLSEIVVEVIGCDEKISGYVEFGQDYQVLQQELNREFERRGINVSMEMKFAISQCVVRQMVEANRSNIDLYSEWREYAVKQRRLV